MNKAYALLQNVYPNVTLDEIALFDAILTDAGKPETLETTVKEFSEYVAFVTKNGFASGLVDTFDDWQANKNLL